MSDVPEDISRAAKECYEGMPIVWDGWDEDAVMLCIAQAILAERNRCAKIAEDTPISELYAANAEQDHKLSFAVGAMAQRDSIAAAIRG